MLAMITGATGGGKTAFTVYKILYPLWKKGKTIYSNTVLKFEDKIRKHGTNIIDHPKNFTLIERMLWWLKKKLRPFFYKIIKFESGSYDPDDLFFWRRNRELIKDALYNWLTIPYRRGKVIYFSDITELIGLKRGVIFIDEGSAIMDARNWEALPREFSNELRQSRKNGLDCFVTTQEIGQVELNYRRLIHEWHECKLTWLHVWQNPVIVGRLKAMQKPLSEMQFSETSITINTDEDEETKTIKTKAFWMTIFRRRLYDTNYQVNFPINKIINVENLNNNLPIKWAIVPISATYREILTELGVKTKISK